MACKNPEETRPTVAGGFAPKRLLLTHTLWESLHRLMKQRRHIQLR
jgi:hypothetical protein